MYKILYLTISMLIFIPGCYSRQESASVINYFWPLNIGAEYVYKTDMGEHRIIIDKINKQNQIVKVYIKEIIPIPNTDIPSKLNTEYLIDLQNNTIYKIIGEEKIIFLKGPIEKGTKWDTNVIISYASEDQITQSLKKATECHIKEMSKQSVLGTERNCFETVCDFKEVGMSIVSCENVGLLGMKIENENWWIEKLDHIKNASESNQSVR